MRLDDIWKTRDDTRLVAYRHGGLVYVALGHNTPDAAAENADISAEDRAADDWTVGEVVSDDNGKVAGFK